MRIKINRKVAFLIQYRRTKKSKYCCHPPFHPLFFCRHFSKLLSPTLQKLMNWILLSPPPLSSDPDNPQNLERAHRKGKCEAGGLFCDYCTKTPTVIHGPVLPVPRPFPDPSRLPDHHHKKCSETPITDAAGNYRLPDDFQPRFQLRSLFSNGLISSDDKAAINNFSTKFVVSEKLVMDYLSHLENLKLRKEKRSEDRKISKAKQLSLKYEDFNWKKLFETNNLKSLTINVLKKYLIKHITFPLQKPRKV